MDKVFVDVDVAKVRLDVAVRPDGGTFTVAHTSEDIAALVECLAARAPERIVLEATGGLERPLTILNAILRSRVPWSTPSPEATARLPRRLLSPTSLTLPPTP